VSAVERARVEELLARLPREIPRHEGDVAFDTAWEIRAFALAVALHETNGFDWAGFQRELIAAIERWEDSAGSDASWRYYDRWLEALERVVISRDLLTGEELDGRTHEVLTTPRDAEHQHAHLEPVAVVPAATR
jgi:nitrile hydratase accessory protein